MANLQAHAQERLLPNVPEFEGKNAAVLEFFIEQLEKCFAVANFTNEQKATAASTKFPYGSPAYDWYQYQKETNRLPNLQIWDQEEAVEARPAEGDRQAVAAREARLGGLKKALKAQWPHEEDLESLIRLQKKNPQRNKEEFSAWLPRLQRNIFRLEKATYPHAFRVTDNKATYDIVHDHTVVKELRIGACAKLQAVFEKLPVASVESYTEAAFAWERTDEGHKWLTQATPPPPPPANGTAATVGAVQGQQGPRRTKAEKAKLGPCDYCGIPKSHLKAECFRRQNDEKNGVKRDRCEGYPLKAKAFGKKKNTGTSGGTGGGSGSDGGSSTNGSVESGRQGSGSSNTQAQGDGASQGQAGLPNHPNQLALAYQGWNGAPGTNAAIYGSPPFRPAFSEFPELGPQPLREALNNYHNSAHHGPRPQ